MKTSLSPRSTLIDRLNFSITFTLRLRADQQTINQSTNNQPMNVDGAWKRRGSLLAEDWRLTRLNEKENLRHTWLRQSEQSERTRRMFPSDEFWKGVMFAAVMGGIITVVLSKLWKKKGTALGKTEIGSKSNKKPTEHDERYQVMGSWRYW